MYYNTLGVPAGRLARLSLPIKTPTTRSCFSFYYSMVSSGRLKVSAEQLLRITNTLSAGSNHCRFIAGWLLVGSCCLQLDFG